MFGYVKTDLPNMYVKDTVLYKGMYCGLCKSIGKCCGCRGRLLLSYDLAFLSTFVHAVVGTDVQIKKERCIMHWFIKRPVATPDEISKRIGCLNVILAYYKLTDDVLDEKKNKTKRAFFKKTYKKCAKKEPKLDLIVKSHYEKLRGFEMRECNSADIVADPFGNMMTELVRELTGEKFSAEIGRVAYNLGKWIYLIDAVDDYQKDRKNQSYNVFVLNKPDYKEKKDFLSGEKEYLTTIFSSVLCDIFENGNKIAYAFNHDLIDNILYKGLREQTKCILEGNKCKTVTKY